MNSIQRLKLGIEKQTMIFKNSCCKLHETAKNPKQTKPTNQKKRKRKNEKGKKNQKECNIKISGSSTITNRT